MRKNKIKVTPEIMAAMNQLLRIYEGKDTKGDACPLCLADDSYCTECPWDLFFPELVSRKDFTCYNWLEKYHQGDSFSNPSAKLRRRRTSMLKYWIRSSEVKP